VFTDGRVGSDPTKASIESGKVLIQLFADAVAEDFRRFMDS
jgi:creatinine amidohydrolase/Fe(II)-dependent formamide hydrolase-like protein